ncbi:HEAT repeat domain-containing protein [Kallotenue papyrolyticum]|uniref:HEAT repeat domain-containing protein n=1 Tax=Kallotenue papyrolyticum TaxID=1325125 RepID=UPI001267E950|nr:HEAT repeat domain-containing protein [Kallotenue papyrolyticum]
MHTMYNDIERLLHNIDYAREKDYLVALKKWVEYVSSANSSIGDILADILLSTPVSNKRRIEALVLGLLERPSHRAREKLEELLLRSDGLGLNREDIVEALGALGNPASIPVLAQACDFEDEYGHFRAKIAWALGCMKTPLAQAVLEKLLKSELPNVAWVAREALNNIRQVSGTSDD